MDKSEKMERMALVSDRTRLPSARQYLMTYKRTYTNMHNQQPIVEPCSYTQMRNKE